MIGDIPGRVIGVMDILQSAWLPLRRLFFWSEKAWQWGRAATIFSESFVPPCIEADEPESVGIVTVLRLGAIAVINELTLTFSIVIDIRNKCRRLCYAFQIRFNCYQADLLCYIWVE